MPIHFYLSDEVMEIYWHVGVVDSGIDNVKCANFAAENKNDRIGLEETGILIPGPRSVL